MEKEAYDNYISDLVKMNKVGCENNEKFFSLSMGEMLKECHLSCNNYYKCKTFNHILNLVESCVNEKEFILINEDSDKKIFIYKKNLKTYLKDKLIDVINLKLYNHEEDYYFFNPFHRIYSDFIIKQINVKSKYSIKTQLIAIIDLMFFEAEMIEHKKDLDQISSLLDFPKQLKRNTKKDLKSDYFKKTLQYSDE